MSGCGSRKRQSKMSKQIPFSDVYAFVAKSGLFLVLLFALAMPSLSLAQDRPLDAPRAQGLVGERFDGYAMVRGNAPADIVALVAKTNAERKALYTQRARSENVPVEAIGKIYAAQIVKSAPAKTWFLSESGTWTQK